MNIITKNKTELRKILQNLINEEFEVTLSELKSKNPGIKIYRNGTYKVNYNSEFGSMILKIPRIRNMEFKSSYLSNSSYSDKIVTLSTELYTNGLSTNRISNIFKKTFNIDISKTTVSLFTSKLDENVSAYFSSENQTEYAVIYLDAKYFSVRSMSSNKSALFSAIGMTKDGKKEHIHMKLITRESKNAIKSFLYELKEKIDVTNTVFVIDGAESMPSAIFDVFGDVSIQRCLVHVARNVKKILRGFASRSEISTIEAKLNYLFFECPNSETTKYIDELFNQHPNHVNKLKNLLKSKFIFTYLNYSDNVGKSIKTNNTIEQFHANLEAVCKQHRTYSDENSLYRAVIREIERYNEFDGEIECLDMFLIENNFQLIDMIKKFKQQDYITIEIRKAGRLVKKQEINKIQYKMIKLAL
jgi:transposase-like protein